MNIFRPLDYDPVFHQAASTALFMIRMASLYVMIEAVTTVFSGTLRGAGDTFWAMCISVTLHWLLLPILVVMLHVLGMSAEAAWTAIVLTFLFFSYVFYLRFRSGRWRQIRMVHSPAELVATEHDQDFHEPPDI